MDIREWLIRITLTLALILFFLFCACIVGVAEYYLTGKISAIIIPISAIVATGLGTFLLIFFSPAERGPMGSRIFSSTLMALLVMVAGIGMLGLSIIILIILAFGYIWLSDDLFGLI